MSSGFLKQDTASLLSSKALKYPASASPAPRPASVRPACSALHWPGSLGPSCSTGMEFQPDLCHQLRVASLLGIRGVGARGRTADPRQEATLPLEWRQGDCLRGSQAQGLGLSWPMGVQVLGITFCPQSGPQSVPWVNQPTSITLPVGASTGSGTGVRSPWPCPWSPWSDTGNIAAACGERQPNGETVPGFDLFPLQSNQRKAPTQSF